METWLKEQQNSTHSFVSRNISFLLAIFYAQRVKTKNHLQIKVPSPQKPCNALAVVENEQSFVVLALFVCEATSKTSKVRSENWKLLELLMQWSNLCLVSGPAVFAAFGRDFSLMNPSSLLRVFTIVRV